MDGFVSDGYQIKVNYTDGSFKFSDITPSEENKADLANASFKFVGDFDSAGTKTVTVYYFGKSTTFDVTTIQATDVEITANKTYRYNSKPNFENDFTVTIVYNDGSKVVSTDASLELSFSNFECEVKTPGTVKAKVTLTNSDYGLSFEKEIDVTVETPTGVEVTKEPTKTEYNVDETFSAKGMVVSLVYADGSKVTVKDTDYTTKVNTSSPGNKSVQIRSDIEGLSQIFSDAKLKTSITVLGGNVGGDTTTTTATTAGNQGQSSNDGGLVLPIIIAVVAVVIIVAVVVVVVISKKKKAGSAK